MKVKLIKQEAKSTLMWEVNLVKIADDYSQLIYRWGQVGGKIQVKTEDVTIGKNIGKKNETTPYQQAHVIFNSKVNSKKKKGYYEEGSIIEQKLPLPMLANKYIDHKNKVKGKVFLQRKFDGIRCVSDNTGKMWTRRGTIISSCPHIAEEIKKLNPKYNLDGELFSEELTFEQITSIVRKEKTLHEDYKKIHYRVYDVIDIKNGFDNRNKYLINLLNSTDLKYTKLVETKTLENVKPELFLEQIQDTYDLFLKEGYEGIMIRLDQPYRLQKRSSSLLKLKPFIDDEFKIVSYEKEKGEERIGAFVLELKNGKRFNARPKATHKKLTEMLSDVDKYIGKFATVTFQEYSVDGVPRFPIFKGVRWDGDK
jgi:DNA ligase-1